MTSRLLISEMHGLAGRAGELQGLLDELAAGARGEDGCLTFSVSRHAQVGEFVVISHWRDEEALRRHFRGDAYERYRAAVDELLARPSNVTVHHVAQSVHAIDPDLPDPGLLG